MLLLYTQRSELQPIIIREASSSSREEQMQRPTVRYRAGESGTGSLSRGFHEIPSLRAQGISQNMRQKNCWIEVKRTRPFKSTKQVACELTETETDSAGPTWTTSGPLCRYYIQLSILLRLMSVRMNRSLTLVKTLGILLCLLFCCIQHPYVIFWLILLHLILSCLLAVSQRLVL